MPSESMKMGAEPLEAIREIWGCVFSMRQSSSAVSADPLTADDADFTDRFFCFHPCHPPDYPSVETNMFVSAGALRRQRHFFATQSAKKAAMLSLKTHLFLHGSPHTDMLGE